MDTGEFGEQIPSVATIGLILAEAGVTKTNARKRPRRAWMRFSRSLPMEMWQIDGLEYRLFDLNGTKATIYQVLDNGTRFDVGTGCFGRPENRDDAITTLRAALEESGGHKKRCRTTGCRSIRPAVATLGLPKYSWASKGAGTSPDAPGTPQPKEK